jgi:hypothetical protein
MPGIMLFKSVQQLLSKACLERFKQAVVTDGT